MKRFILILTMLCAGFLCVSFLSAVAFANDFSQFGIPQGVPFTYSGVTYDYYIVFQTNTGNPNNCATVRVEYFNSTEYASGSFGFIRSNGGSWAGLILPSTPSHYVATASMSGTYPNCSWDSLSYTQAGSSFNLYSNKGQALADVNFYLKAMNYMGLNFPYTFTGSFSSYGTVNSGDAIMGPAHLGFPLSGILGDRTILLEFGDIWTFGECPTGVYKKHSGLDLDATATEEVYAAHDGTVKAIYTGQHAQWADAIVIEDDSGQFTTVYWHIAVYGNLAVNDTVTKGQQVATIADLGTDTHLHFGIRLSSYDDNFSLAGALPQNSCGTSPAYPAFPEFFIDPQVITYE